MRATITDTGMARQTGRKRKMAEPVEERVAALEALQGTIRDDIHDIKTNHLPHLSRKIDTLQLWIMGALFSALATLAVQVLF